MENSNRTCSKCGERKDVSAFYSRSDRAGAAHSSCKACQGKYHAARYQLLKETTDKRTKQWRADNPEAARRISVASQEKHYKRRMLYLARVRAEKKGLPFSITEADILFPAICPVLGLTLDYSLGSKAGLPKPNSPSLDRRVPQLGYVPGNIAVISYRANSIKNDATPGELALVAEYFGAGQ